MTKFTVTLRRMMPHYTDVDVEAETAYLAVEKARADVEADREAYGWSEGEEFDDEITFSEVRDAEGDIVDRDEEG